MRRALVQTGHCEIELDASPIESSWIIEGNPEARSRLLSVSACNTIRTEVRCEVARERMQRNREARRSRPIGAYGLIVNAYAAAQWVHVARSVPTR